MGWNTVISASPRSNTGFTLVEVLVALGIVALTLPALMLVLQQLADGAAHSRDKTVASWVASDRLERLRLETADGKDPEQTAGSGTTAMAGREWEWTLEHEQTPIEGLRRFDVTVTAPRDETPLITLSTFLRTLPHAESPAP